MNETLPRNPEVQGEQETSKTEWDSLGDKTMEEYQAERLQEAVERLHEKVINITEQEAGALKDEFPDGNYVFHGTSLDSAKKIIESGFLGNAASINDGNVGRNSGYEGISWSMNGIDALPGEEGHIVGFIASPEDVLGDDTKLVIPSRPAPYEMLQISEEIETEDFFEARIQDELLNDRAIGVTVNSLVQNLIEVSLAKKFPDFMPDGSILTNFLKKEWTADNLRALYSTNQETGFTDFSKELFQQYEIPVAAVCMQKIIDAKWMESSQVSDEMKNLIKEGGYDNMDVRQMIEAINNGDENIATVIRYFMGYHIKHREEVLSNHLDKAKPVKIPISEMYLVTNKEDVEGLIQELAESGQTPKGILLYDDEKVKRPNFASKEKGDQEELTSEFDHVIGTNKSFWEEQMGINIENTSRSGGRGQVLKETEIKTRNRVGKIVDGKFTIVQE